jgi:hypothetical protein
LAANKRLHGSYSATRFEEITGYVLQTDFWRASPTCSPKSCAPNFQFAEPISQTEFHDMEIRENLTAPEILLAKDRETS